MAAAPVLVTAWAVALDLAMLWAVAMVVKVARAAKAAMAAMAAMAAKVKPNSADRILTSAGLNHKVRAASGLPAKLFSAGARYES